jgi:hypothetical protein
VVSERGQMTGVNLAALGSDRQGGRADRRPAARRPQGPRPGLRHLRLWRL